MVSDSSFGIDDGSRGLVFSIALTGRVIPETYSFETWTHGTQVPEGEVLGLGVADAARALDARLGLGRNRRHLRGRGPASALTLLAVSHILPSAPRAITRGSLAGFGWETR